jgi:hypothetical protein
MHHEGAKQRRDLPCRHESWHTFFDSALLIEVGVVRRVAGQQLVRQCTETIYIVGGCWWLTAQLCGARGKWREAVPVGIPSRRGRRSRRSGVGRRRRRHGCFSDTEICQASAASYVEQNIARLQVPMDDSALMCVLERLGNLQEYRDDLEEARTAQATKIAAGSELHRQNHCVARAFWRKHLEDGRMIEPARNCVLVLEGAPALSLMCGGIQHLEGDVDPARTIVRAPYFALPARAQLVQQRVARVELSTLDRYSGLSHILSRLRSLFRSMRPTQRDRLDLR